VDDFDEFFIEHYRRVVGSLELSGGAPGDAEDAAQEAFVKAMLRWRSVSTMDRPATWVYVVAVRGLRRRLGGRDRRDFDLDEREPVFRDETEEVVTAAVISSALDMLPPRQRLALVLRFHGDLSVPEIARAMRCSPGTVKATLHAGLGRLRVDLGDTSLEGARDAR
jgi:RNA polymerase sigma-70 factor (ECF subfamily)